MHDSAPLKHHCACLLPAERKQRFTSSYTTQAIVRESHGDGDHSYAKYQKTQISSRGNLHFSAKEAKIAYRAHFEYGPILNLPRHPQRQHEMFAKSSGPLPSVRSQDHTSFHHNVIQDARSATHPFPYYVQSKSQGHVKYRRIGLHEQHESLPAKILMRASTRESIKHQNQRLHPGPASLDEPLAVPHIQHCIGQAASSPRMSGIDECRGAIESANTQRSHETYQTTHQSNLKRKRTRTDSFSHEAETTDNMVNSRLGLAKSDAIVLEEKCAQSNSFASQHRFRKQTQLHSDQKPAIESQNSGSVQLLRGTIHQAKVECPTAENRLPMKSFHTSKLTYPRPQLGVKGNLPGSTGDSDDECDSMEHALSLARHKMAANASLHQENSPREMYLKDDHTNGDASTNGDADVESDTFLTDTDISRSESIPKVPETLLSMTLEERSQIESAGNLDAWLTSVTTSFEKVGVQTKDVDHSQQKIQPTMRRKLMAMRPPVKEYLGNTMEDVHIEGTVPLNDVDVVDVRTQWTAQQRKSKLPSSGSDLVLVDHCSARADREKTDKASFGALKTRETTSNRQTTATEAPDKFLKPNGGLTAAERTITSLRKLAEDAEATERRETREKHLREERIKLLKEASFGCTDGKNFVLANGIVIENSSEVCLPRHLRPETPRSLLRQTSSSQPRARKLIPKGGPRSGKLDSIRRQARNERARFDAKPIEPFSITEERAKREAKAYQDERARSHILDQRNANQAQPRWQGSVFVGEEEGCPSRTNPTAEGRHDRRGPAKADRIRPEDEVLWLLRQYTGFSFNHLQPLYNYLCGKNVTVDTLCKRHSQLESSMQTFMSGKRSDRSKNCNLLEDMTDKHAPHAILERMARTPTLPDHQALQPQEPRPTTGGKTLSWGTFQALMKDYADANEDMKNEEREEETIFVASEPKAKREESPFEESDYVHYTYQVSCQVWSGCVSMDEDPPEDVSKAHIGEPCSSKEDAIGVLRRSIAIDRPPYYACSIRLSKMERSEDDLLTWNAVTFDGVGIRLSIEPVLRTFHERLRPTSKENWLARQVFDVVLRRKHFDLVPELPGTEQSHDAKKSPHASEPSPAEDGLTAESFEEPVPVDDGGEGPIDNALMTELFGDPVPGEDSAGAAAVTTTAAVGAGEGLDPEVPAQAVRRILNRSTEEHVGAVFTIKDAANRAAGAQYLSLWREHLPGVAKGKRTEKIAGEQRRLNELLDRLDEEGELYRGWFETDELEIEVEVVKRQLRGPRNV